MRKDYETGRIVAKLQAALGWGSMLCSAGFLVACILARSSDSPGAIGTHLASMEPGSAVMLGALLFFGGLLGVTVAQGVCAQIDAADYSRQILKIALFQDSAKELSHQPLPFTREDQTTGEQDEISSSDPRVAVTFLSKGWQVHKLDDGTYAVNTKMGWQRYKTFKELQAATS